MAVDGLLVLPADFEDAAAKRSLEEGRDGSLGELVCGLFELLVGRLAGNAGQLLRRGNLRVGIAGSQQIMREIRERLVARKLPEF